MRVVRKRQIRCLAHVCFCHLADTGAGAKQVRSGGKAQMLSSLIWDIENVEESSVSGVYVAGHAPRDVLLIAVPPREAKLPSNGLRFAVPEAVFLFGARSVDCR